MYTASAIESATEAGAGASETKIPVIFEAIVPAKKNEETRWEIGFAISQEQQFQQVSFVNRISTTKGGTHVLEMADQIAKRLYVFVVVSCTFRSDPAPFLAFPGRRSSTRRTRVPRSSLSRSGTTCGCSSTP